MTYPLVTERISIAPLGAADIDEFVAYRTEPAVARWQGWETTYSRDDAGDLVAAQPVGDLPEAGGWLQLAIHPVGGGALLGDVAIHRVADQPDTYEIGITLAPAAQGRGFAAEAIARVIRFLFQDNAAHRVIANCDARNGAVHATLLRAGMRQESHLVDADFFKGEWTSVDGFAVLASEWTVTPGGRP